jgi:hypothetical protein
VASGSMVQMLRPFCSSRNFTLIHAPSLSKLSVAL